MSDAPLKPRRMPGVRTVVTGLTAVLVLFAAESAYVGMLAGGAAAAIDAAQARRERALQLVDEARRSWSEQSRMARLFVSSGQRRYRDYYDRIVAIREGAAPRPVDYDASFWDRALDRGLKAVAYGEPRALRALMADAGFTAGELATLDGSREPGERVATLERAAMGNAGRRPMSADAQRLAGADYLRQEARVVDALDALADGVDRRTRAELERLAARDGQLRRWQRLIAGLLLAYSLVMLAALDRLGALPLRRLQQAAERFRRGLHGERLRVVALREIEQLARAFNRMAASIQHDAERHERSAQELRESRAQLAESAIRLRQVAGVADVMFWIAEPGFATYHYISPAFERLWGRPTDELYRDPAKLLEWTYFEDIAALSKLMKDASGGRPASLEHRVLRADGQVHWVATRAFPVWGEDGSLARIAGTTTDIGEQRRLQDEVSRLQGQLAAGDERFGRLADAADVVFWVADADCARWRYCNPAYERLWGWSAAELCAEPARFFQALHPEDVAAVTAALAAAGGGGEANVEYRLRTRGGELRWARGRVCGVRDAGGAVTAVAGIATDISAHKALEGELKASRARSR